jgi:hypothetical protein
MKKIQAAEENKKTSLKGKQEIWKKYDKKC